MPETGTTTDELLRRARDGDQAALGALFLCYRERLGRMVRLRLDRRLSGRIDASDVLQEAYLDVARRFGEYLAAPTVPFFIWLRSLTGQRLVDLHRRHLGAGMRDAGREVSIHRGALPAASSASLAHQLLAGLTSPTQAAVRAEMKRRLQEALNGMDPIDREAVVLRHFEELSNAETAEVQAADGRQYPSRIECNRRPSPPNREPTTGRAHIVFLMPIPSRNRRTRWPPSSK